jgi:hypothetical protein
MTDINPTSAETPEEVLEAEIEDLEKRTLTSGGLWAAAAVGLIILAGAAFLFTSWDNRRHAGHAPAFAPELIRLKEPYGEVDSAGLFRWEAVDEAASYIVMVRAAQGDEVELLRPVRENFLRPSETEAADLASGNFIWSVEARARSGTLIGYGEGNFSIRATAP